MTMKFFKKSESRKEKERLKRSLSRVLDRMISKDQLEQLKGELREGRKDD